VGRRQAVADRRPAIGNHDFDDGREAMPELPLLCANADAELPPSALIGELGVIGLTHPAVHELTRAPEPYATGGASTPPRCGATGRLGRRAAA
jgi:hypothetical protein